MMKLVAMVDLPVQCTLTALCFWMVMVIMISAKWSETLHTGAALARATVPIGQLCILCAPGTAAITASSYLVNHECRFTVSVTGQT